MRAKRQRYDGLGLLCLLALVAGCDAHADDAEPNSEQAAVPTAEVSQASAGSTATGATTTGSTADPSAQQLLTRVGEAYQQANTYADQGQVTLHFEHEGRPIDQTADFAVSFQRPNKIRLHCYQGHVLSDGVKLHAWIDDLAGQVLQRDAPVELSQENIYADEILTSVLTLGIAGSPPQLALLLDPAAINAIASDTSKARLLDPAKTGGHDCYRLALARNEGELVMWIDRASSAVRRIEYPTAELAKMISSEQFQPQDLRLWVDFTDARFGAVIDPVAFAFEAPADAKMVARFMPPLPAPPPLSPLLGKPVPEFAFVGLDGEPVTAERTRGKVTVLDFWATWCGPCMQSMPMLNEAREQLQGRDDVQFVAVSIDEPSVTDDQLRDKLAEISVGLPIARDPQQYARDAFGVEGIPFMVVIDADGVVQMNEVGLNPNIASELPAKIDRIVAGENIYEEEVNAHAERVKQHEAAQQTANESAAAGEPQLATIAPKSEPQSLSLEQAWQTTELARPGNILVTGSAAGDETVYVHAGWSEVVEIDGAGAVTARHTLELEDKTAVSFLRTAVDAQGARYFVGSANAQQKLYAFDAEFNRILTFPESEHAGISDVRLWDVNGNGSLEMVVGYWGVVGVQAVSLTGERLWSNRSLENVFRLTVARTGQNGEAEVLCTNARGSLIPLDGAGEALAERVVEQRFLRSIEAADLDGDGVDELCAISTDAQRNDEAVGLSATGEVLWTTPLPAGLHEFPLEMITSGPLLGGEHVWVLGAADGSIHIVSRDGQLIDAFNYGEALAGIGVTTGGGQPTLLVATASGVTAWRVGH
jgi:thiol-disulfide isomerase/thioredoxin